MRRKIQLTMFVWAYELQTPKLEHGFKINADPALSSGTSYDPSDGQEKIENRMLDVVKNRCFKV